MVWSVNMERQAELESLDDFGLAHALEQASHGALGGLELCGPRSSWPLQLGKATHWTGKSTNDPLIASWALAGDAAHQVHPLAGQGLNLGLADVADLASILGARDYWRGVGDLRLLRRYERQRKLAMAPLAWTMDGIQRSFALGQGTWRELRNAGMNGFDRMGPLKAWVVAQATGQA